MTFEERKQKLEYIRRTSPRVSWNIALQALTSGRPVRRAAWMEMKLETSASDSEVVHCGPAAIRSRWFEGVDGDVHLCMVDSAGDNHPAFPYALVQDDAIATDWIILNEEDASL